jgi:PAS domain S-box-containing protein
LSSAGAAAHILVVEDDNDVRRLIGDQLVRLGYEVSRVSTLAECVKALRENPKGLDLVLLDRYLPDGDGCSVIEQMHAALPGQPKVPVVVISVDPSGEGVARALSAGAVDYLVKPFESKVLDARVSAAIREARQKETLLKTQQVLARTKKELELVFDAVGEAILVVDSELKLRRINRAGMALAGKISFDQVLGRNWWEVLYGESPADVEDAASRAIREHGECQESVALELQGRTVRHLHRAYFMERADSGGGMAVVIVEDVTARHDSEEERLRIEKLEAVMRLAGGLAHEISQPLAAVSGRAELLEMSISDEAGSQADISRHVENLRSNSRRLSEIVRKLQNISDYVTKPYYGSAEILDLERSSGSTVGPGDALTERDRKEGA